MLTVSGVARFCEKRKEKKRKVFWRELQYAESAEIVDDFPIFSKRRNEVIMYLL